MLFPNKRKYIGIGQNELKNIGISGICKNPISCIPNYNIYSLLHIFLYYTTELVNALALNAHTYTRSDDFISKIVQQLEGYMTFLTSEEVITALFLKRMNILLLIETLLPNTVERLGVTHA